MGLPAAVSHRAPQPFERSESISPQPPHHQAAHRVQGEDVDLRYQQHVTCPEGEQNEETPHQEGFDVDIAQFRPLRLYSHTDAECQREKVERFELQKYSHQQVNGMVAQPACV